MRFFYHFLATELGMTVRELLANVGADEITDWMAYYYVREEYRNKEQKSNPKDFRNNFEAFVDGANNTSR